MADRIISGVLNKYMSVFIKNWSKDALSLSFLRGEGVLNNLEFNEEVVQEVMSIPFLQVNRVHVSQLRCKLPSLTRLNNDPLCVMMDHLTIEISEPMSARPITTPLADFIKSMSQSSSSSNSGESSKKYGFIEKLIDGISVEVKRVTFLVKTLGPHPSQMVGHWTPPCLKIELLDFKMVATNSSWNVVDLKYALPKFDKNKPVLTLYKKGTMKSLSVHLVHPLNVATNNNNNNTYNRNQQQQQQQIYPDVTLVEHVSALIKIMHKKKAVGGKPLGASIDVLIGDVSISLNQFDLSYVIRFLMGFQAASQRQDLIGPHVEFMKKKLKSQDRKSESTSTVSGTGRTTTALNKFLSKKPSEDEVDLDMLTDDTDTDADLVSVQANNINSPGPSDEDDVQVRVNIFLNNAKAEFKNGPISYLIEVFGFNLTVITPPQSIDKYIEMVVPYCHFRYMDAENRGQTVDVSENEDAIMLENIIGPKLNHPVYNETPEMLEKVADQYTIDMELWPEFLPDPSMKNSTRKKRYDTHFSNPYALGYKHKFFEEGREMVRFKFIVSPATKNFVFEMRVNPVQGIAHVKKLLSLTEYILGSFPDMSILPPEDQRIVFPSFIPSESRRRRKENDRELDDEASIDEFESDDPKISFVIQVKDPSIYVPSNTEVGDFSGISEMLRISAKELTITFDPRLPRPSWADETEDTLYVPKFDSTQEMYMFPSCNEDYTSFNRAMWEVLPVKLKFNLTQFCFDLLPSFTAPPQKIMKPLSINFDLAVNDPDLSDFNRKLPMVVIMTRVPKLDFHLTQNQCILLLDWVKTYLDDPPEISALLLKNTQQFARANHQIIMNQRRRKKAATFREDSRFGDELTEMATDEDISDEVSMLERSDRELAPVFVGVKLEELALSISLSSNNVAEIFDPNYESMEAPLTSINLVGAEFILETHESSRKMIIKTRVESLLMLSPPPRSEQSTIDPSSVLIAHKTFKGTPHVFYKHHKTDSQEKEYMVLMRYEHPMHVPLNRKTTPVSKLYNTNYPMNPLLIFKLDGVHMGLNANSVFKILKFMESRDNIFDTSPIEFMTQTVGRTVAVLKDRITKISKAVKDNSTATTPLTPLSGATDNVFKTEGTTDQIQINVEHGETTQQEVEQVIPSPKSATPTTDSTIVQVVDSPSSTKKKKRKRIFSSKTGRPVYPILWEVDVTNVEIFVVEDKVEVHEREQSNALGIEVETMKVKHEPRKREGTHYEFNSNTYSAFQLLAPTIKETPPCYHTKEFDFAMGASASGAIFSSLVFTKDDNTLRRTELSDAVSLELELKSDYNMPLNQRGIMLQLSKHDPSTLAPFSWNISLTPQLLSAITALIKGQIEEVKQFAFLLRFIRSPAADLAQNFNRLQSEINRTQRAITRAVFSQDALGDAVRKLQVDIAEKEEALQTAIQDKLRLTTMLAESMSAQYSRSPQQAVRSVQAPSSPQIQSAATTQPQPTQPSQAKEPKAMILMEGSCSLLLSESQTWRKVFGILMGTQLIFLTQRIALNEIRDPVARKKYTYSTLWLNENSESFKTYAPVNEREPKKVLYVSNSDIEALYINTENEQAMADWTRVIERTIEAKKEEKQEADRLEKERLEQEQREEQERIEREERERIEQEKQKQEEQERMDKEREYDVSRGVASIAIQTDFHDEEDQMNQDQKTLRQIEELLVQFTIMRESMQGAKKEHDLLQEKMTELTEYVKQVKQEEGSRLENIQNKIKHEAERSRQEEAIRHENAELKQQLMRKGQKVLELERDLDKEKKTVFRVKEEHQMLAENMRLHFVVIEDQLNRVTGEKNILKRELEAYETQRPPTRRLSIRDRTPHQRIPSDEDVNSELKVIIQDLYQQLAAKDDEIKMLRMKNVELNSRGGSSTIVESSYASVSFAESVVTQSRPPSAKHVPLPPIPVRKPLPPPPNFNSQQPKDPSAEEQVDRITQ